MKKVAVNPDLATLIALLDEAVSNHHAGKSRRRRQKLEAKPRRCRAQHPRMDAAKLEKMLNAEGRQLYERWKAQVAKLAVKVSDSERRDVLRELVGRRAA